MPEPLTYDKDDFELDLSGINPQENTEKQDTVNEDGIDIAGINPDPSLKRWFGAFIQRSKEGIRSIATSKRLDALFGQDPFINQQLLQNPMAYTEALKRREISKRNKAISQLSQEMPGIEPTEKDIQSRMIDVDRDDRQQVASWWEELEKTEFLQTDPEYKGKSSGFVEDVSGAIGSSWMGSIITGLNPVIGAEIIYRQMHGATAEGLEKQGVSSKQAHMAGQVSAAISLPLELAGEAFKFRAIFPNSGKWITRLLLAGEAFGGESLTEYLQQYPEDGAEIWARNPDLTPDELINHIADTFGSWKFQKEAGYSGLVGGFAALGTVGVGQTVTTSIDYLLTDKQKRINREKAQKFTEIISKESPSKDDAQELLRIMGIRDDVAGKMLDQVKDESVNDIIETVKSRVLHQSEPIKSIARDRIITAVKSHGNFTPEQTAAYVNIWDGIAYSLTESGDIESPDDFYNMWSFEAGETVTDNPMFQSGQRVVRFIGYQDILKTGQPQPIFEIMDSPVQAEIGSTLTERGLKERLIPVPDYKPAESFFNKIQQPDLKTMEVESKAIDESTGEILSIKENYEQALIDVDERYEKYLQLMECLKS